MINIKKRFIRLGMFFSCLLAPLMAMADDGTYVKIINAFRGDDAGCWFCPVFSKLFDAINDIANSLQTVLSERGKELLALGLLFYLLFKVLKAVISFGAINPKEFFTDLLMQILKCLVVVVVLNNLPSFYKSVVNPMAVVSISFSTEISKHTGSMGLSNFEQVKSSGRNLSKTNICPEPSVGSSEVEKGVFSPAVNDAIQCFLKISSASILQYMALGATFLADCWGKGWMGVLPSFSMLFIGVCIFTVSFCIFLSFPFKLLDGMFQLMFVAALMPAWIILWVLPPTRQYSKKAFDTFISVLISFICLSVVLLMVLSVLDAAMDGFVSYNGRGGIDKFWNLMTAGKTDAALTMIDWSGKAFFVMFALLFLALSLSQKADSLAKSFGFSAGGSVGMGSALQGMAMVGASMAASKVAKPAVGKTIDAVKGTPHAVGFVAGRFRSAGGVDPNTGETKWGLNPFRKSDIPNLIPGGKALKDMKEGFEHGSGRSVGEKNVVTLPNGNKQITVPTTYTDENGRATHRDVKVTTLGPDNKTLIEKIMREYLDEKGNVTGKANIQTNFDADGKAISKKMERFNGVGDKVSEIEHDLVNHKNVKKDFDPNTGNVIQTTERQYILNTKGKHVGFGEVVKDATGAVVKDVTVNLLTKWQQDQLTGAESKYKAPKNDEMR